MNSAHSQQSSLLDYFLASARRLIDDSGVARPPVDPKLLAGLQGIKRIVQSYSLHVSGQLIGDKDGLVIALNAKEPIERQNFTCLHEIAHTFLIAEPSGKLRRARGLYSCLRSSPQERLCDLAAAEMLMPEKFFRPMATDLHPSMASLEELARTFLSSIRSTIIRLGQLSVWPVVFVVWKFTNHGTSSPKLRVAWSTKPSGYRCFVPRNASADPASGMYATFSVGHQTMDVEALNLGSLRGKYVIENGRFGDCVLSIVHEPRLRKEIPYANC